MEVEKPLTPRLRISQLVHAANPTLAATSILIVGVGGIGCEILKVVSKSAIGCVHILDMDTIELSNLNRQFLFKQAHKGHSKSLVARESILQLNPHLNITAHHMNIKDLPIAFFRQFHFIILALDNIEARNYVNKIGVRLDIPIVDAGTLAYKGNATTILAGRSRCYSCEPKSSNQKVFPVCTIRMRPEKPIHCIVWAKMLFEAAFGPQNEDNDLKDLSVLCQGSDEQTVLAKLFQQDIEDIKNAKSDTDNKLSQIFAKHIRTLPAETIADNTKRQLIDAFRSHDKVLPESDSVAVFAQSFRRLHKQRGELGSVVFEKDDDDVIHFISTAANLRMYCFNIQQQSFNEVKNMAGNIVPAIASTNSIVSGIEVIEMLKYLRSKQETMRSYFIQNQHNKIIALKLEKPLPNCAVCSPDALPATVECDFHQYTLQNLVDFVSQTSPDLQEFSINQGSKEIYNSDDPKEALLAKTIFQICEAYELDLILTDEDTSRKVCLIWMVHAQNAPFSATNTHKLIPQPLPEPIEQETPVAQDEDSDMVVFGEDSPELQIIQIRKRPNETAMRDFESNDQLKKRPKLQ